MLRQETEQYMPKYQVIIGRAEHIDFVGTSLSVPAKIDTGAFRSSVHASNIKEIKNKNGKKVLKFDLLGHPCAPTAFPLEATRYDKVLVKSSNGSEEIRYEITIKIKIGPKIFDTSFTLANRANNVYPILIGRKALNDRFVVDSAKTSVPLSELKRTTGLVTSDDAEDLED